LWLGKNGSDYIGNFLKGGNVYVDFLIQRMDVDGFVSEVLNNVKELRISNRDFGII